MEPRQPSNQNPMNLPQQPIMETQSVKKSSVGPLIGIIIIVIVLIAGGLYIYGQTLITNKSLPSRPTGDSESSMVKELENISTQSTSDEPEDILKDLETIPPENL